MVSVRRPPAVGNKRPGVRNAGPGECERDGCAAHFIAVSLAKSKALAKVRRSSMVMPLPSISTR